MCILALELAVLKWPTVSQRDPWEAGFWFGTQKWMSAIMQYASAPFKVTFIYLHSIFCQPSGYSDCHFVASLHVCSNGMKSLHK